MRPILEVCVDSVRSARAAIDGGADRLEVCTCLSAGGLTPSTGLLSAIRALDSDIPLMVMIRPRPGDFVYCDLDVEQMLAEIESIKSAGLADGFVTGVLSADGSVDRKKCKKLLDACSPLPVTFHRAFDLSADAVDAMEAIISMGFSRILTSGQSKSAKAGIEIIQILLQKAEDRITIIAGSGINDKNLETILRETRVREIHASASKVMKSVMQVQHETVSMGKQTEDDFQWIECDPKIVASMISIIKRSVFTFNGPTDGLTSASSEPTPVDQFSPTIATSPVTAVVNGKHKDSLTNGTNGSLEH